MAKAKPRTAGSPAHAGMVPPYCPNTASDPGLPRTRGDGPPPWPTNPAEMPAPPHTRGWSRRIVPIQLLTLGSPAHAGMVPHLGPRTRPRCRLPRTRGDGASPVRSIGIGTHAPPREGAIGYRRFVREDRTRMALRLSAVRGNFRSPPAQSSVRPGGRLTVATTSCAERLMRRARPTVAPHRARRPTSRAQARRRAAGSRVAKIRRSRAERAEICQP